MLDLKTAEQFLHDMSTFRVASDVEALTDFFDDDATFMIVGVGAPSTGKTAIRSALQALVARFEFIEWQQIKIFVSGHELAVRHRLKVHDRTTGKIADTETCEFISLRDGKCSSYVQFADTALVRDLGVP